MKKQKPYILITVYGGVADLGEMIGDVEYDILDYDNLKEQLGSDEYIELSDGEAKFLRKNDASFYNQIVEHNKDKEQQ